MRKGRVCSFKVLPSTVFLHMQAHRVYKDPLTDPQYKYCSFSEKENTYS